MRISDWSSDVCSSDLSSVDPVAAIDDVRPKLRICWDRSEVAEIHKADVRNAVADADDRFIGRFGAIFGEEVARRMPLAEPWRQIGEIVAVKIGRGAWWERGSREGSWWGGAGEINKKRIK